MPKVRSNPGTAKCLKIDKKQQENSQELVDLAKTIKGVQVKEKHGTTYVTFPPEMLPRRAKAAKRYAADMKKLRLLTVFSTRGSRKLEAPHHYSAIMLK